MKESSKDQRRDILKDMLLDVTHRKNASRVDVIVSVGNIDFQLVKVITKKLNPAMNDADELLSEGAPVGSLMLRAKLAYRMGLISHELYGVIRCLSKIRNLSAHSNERFDIFSRDEVKSFVSNMASRIDPEFNTGSSIEQKFNTVCDLVILELENLEASLTPIRIRETEVIFIP
jgi:hypothetical protein